MVDKLDQHPARGSNPLSACAGSPAFLPERRIGSRGGDGVGYAFFADNEVVPGSIPGRPDRGGSSVVRTPNVGVSVCSSPPLEPSLTERLGMA